MPTDTIQAYLNYPLPPILISQDVDTEAIDHDK